MGRTIRKAKLFTTLTIYINRNWKKLTDSRKRAKILADNRKSYHPIETLLLLVPSGVLLDCGTPVNRIFFLLFMSMSPIDGKFASRFLFELKRVLSTRVLARSTPIRFVTVVFFSSL